MKHPLIIAALLLSVSLPGQDFLGWMAGNWKGTGYQVPTDTTWPIDMTYNSSTQTISVKYPTLNCSGKWKFVKTKGKRAEFVELIEEGQENCDNQVRVIVTYVDEDFISVAYFIPWYSDDVVAHSVLRRQAGV